MQYFFTLRILRKTKNKHANANDYAEKNMMQKRKIKG